MKNELFVRWIQEIAFRPSETNLFMKSCEKQLVLVYYG